MKNNVSAKIIENMQSDTDNVDRMCGFIGDLYTNASEDFTSYGESLYDWCEGGETFINAGYPEEDCKVLNEMLMKLTPLFDEINKILYSYDKEYLRKDDTNE